MADVCSTAVDLCVEHGLGVNSKVANNRVVINVRMQSHFNTMCLIIFTSFLFHSLGSSKFVPLRFLIYQVKILECLIDHDLHLSNPSIS